MTICIGALAANAKAIVCVADKYISYGAGVSGDSDSSKIVELSNGVHALIAGNDTAVSRMLAKLTSKSDIGLDAGETKDYCETAYREMESEIPEAVFLRPFLKIEDFNNAITAPQVNAVMESISKNINESRQQQTHVSCTLLLCGFEEGGNPFIIDISGFGLATNLTHTGFHAVGSGFDYALAKLLTCEYKRSSPIDRVLYECYDAKATAEQDPNVGYDWDAVIITQGRADRVPQTIKTMIDRAWTAHTRTPYEVFDPDENIPLPPENWKEKLREYAVSLMPSDPQTSEDQQ